MFYQLFHGLSFLLIWVSGCLRGIFFFSTAGRRTAFFNQAVSSVDMQQMTTSEHQRMPRRSESQAHLYGRRPWLLKVFYHRSQLDWKESEREWPCMRRKLKDCAISLRLSGYTKVHRRFSARFYFLQQRQLLWNQDLRCEPAQKTKFRLMC